MPYKQTVIREGFVDEAAIKLRVIQHMRPKRFAHRLIWV